MTTQHTQGEWIAQFSFNNPLPETDHWVVRERAIGGKIICKLYGDSAEANGRLIAASPRLLEALEVILPLYENRLSEQGFDKETIATNPRIQRARAAIAAAKEQSK